MNFNLLLIVFIIGIVVLLVLWAFNTVRQIEIQKDYCVRTLIDVAKLWRRAKFVPEDAKERESLYLYRDFLRKFEGEDCKRPLMLKNGGVRCMTRQEFDGFAKFKPVKQVSILFIGASALVAIIALVANLISKSFFMGLGLAIVLPVVQVILMLFLKKLIKEKDAYRDDIFNTLKENCLNFVSITKPFIVVDAYPEKFGKNAEPLYIAKGEPTAEQIADIRNFIALQRQADRNFEPRPVNNQPVMEQLPNATPAVETVEPVSIAPEPVVSEMEAPETPVVSEPTTTEPEPAIESVTEPVTEPAIESATATEPAIEAVTTPTENKENVAPAPVDSEEPKEPTAEELEAAVDNILNGVLLGDIHRAVREAQKQNTVAESTTEQPAEKLEATENTPVTEAPVQDTSAEEQPVVDKNDEPAEDDFSLEAIGRALDAEIARRNQKN